MAQMLGFYLKLQRHSAAQRHDLLGNKRSCASDQRFAAGFLS